jgi:hypothetical protein
VTGVEKIRLSALSHKMRDTRKRATYGLRRREKGSAAVSAHTLHQKSSIRRTSRIICA